MGTAGIDGEQSVGCERVAFERFRRGRRLEFWFDDKFKGVVGIADKGMEGDGEDEHEQNCGEGPE